ncbi:MAG TPA: amino acid ABC transporter substrate-binding protein [Azospirillum sp.]|nr:amino acid ABC transporter substrate-binding protein [Azospirillum sp.]
MRRLGILILMMTVWALAGGSAQAGGTLERVKRAGVLRCGVTTSGTGLAAVDDHGRWQGFYVDLCRAVAVAVTGSADAIEFIELNAQRRFTVLHEGGVDVLMDGATWTLHRNAVLDVEFPVVYLFDGQGFMTHRSLGITRLSDLREGTVCVIRGTTTERNLEDWIAVTGRKLAVKTVNSTEGGLSAFFNHHCDVLTNDRISLFAQRLLNAPHANDYVILPEVISKEPLCPTIAPGDAEWYKVVRWVILATVLAEERGVAAADAVALNHHADPEVNRLLGLTPGVGAGLGLDDQWAYRVIAQIGNYGEIYDRHLGGSSPLGIERGLNALWNRGGLMYAPPLGG